MKKYLLLAAAVLPLFFFSCKSNPSSPEDNIQPGRRDYVWTVDTLQAVLWYQLWGSSPENLWAVGDGQECENEILRYDGKKWKTGGFRNFFSPECVFGTSEYDVWIGNNSGMIYHYDGNSLKLIYTYKKDKSSSIIFSNICGDSPDNIYAVGILFFGDMYRRGFVLHYDGNEWKEVYVANENSQFPACKLKDHDLFITSDKLNFATNSFDTAAIWKYNNGMQVLFSSPYSQIKGVNIDRIGNDIGLITGRELNYYRHNDIVKVSKFDIPNYDYQISGRNSKDLFLAQTDGVAHYNGNNTEYLFKFPNTGWIFIGAPVIFDKDIFYYIYDRYNNYSMILHGKLKDN